MHESNARSNRPSHAQRPVNVSPQTATSEASQPHAHVHPDRCRISLIKGEHRWRFRWEPGSEAALISAVADLARNPRMRFDWFDAAVVCRHIAQGLPEHRAAGESRRPSSSPPGNK